MNLRPTVSTEECDFAWREWLSNIFNFCDSWACKYRIPHTCSSS